jgi:hypothetical protein
VPSCFTVGSRQNGRSGAGVASGVTKSGTEPPLKAGIKKAENKRSEVEKSQYPK